MISRKETMEDPQIAVFTYGSLLDAETTRYRAPSARRGGRAVLKDWRLAFRRGVADIAPDPGRQVLGAVWLVGPDDLDSLDQYEGIDLGAYWRYRLPVETRTGETWAWAYVMPPDDAARGLPDDGYLRIVSQGLRQWGHPTDELDRAVEEARTEAGARGAA